MAKNAKTTTLNDSTNDYQDDNNGVLYDLALSKDFTHFTVTVFNEQTFNEITTQLNSTYSFKTTSNALVLLQIQKLGLRRWC